MMTGLYPAGHGLHENARYVPADRPVLAERLHQAGYRTAAYVSSFVLARRFGLARGFDRYDDESPAGQAERSSKDTTDAALSELGAPPAQPLFLWVHYYDPHTPYAPPEPYRTKYAATPYLGEVAAMDEQLGRLVQAFDRAVHRTVGDRRRRRSRRRARRSRRSAARDAAVSVDDPRAARGDRARESPPASRPRR